MLGTGKGRGDKNPGGPDALEEQEDVGKEAKEEVLDDISRVE